MLPPGHIAAGFITTKVLLNVFHPQLTPLEHEQLIWWGMFFSFAPDLDMFYSFAKEKAFIVKGSDSNHRKFYSHAPILWLLAGLGIYFIAPGVYVKYIGLLLWLGSWTHFVLDSIDYGIMWFWPFSRKVYALRNREVNLVIPEKTFWRYWISFIKQYSKWLSFYLEILIIISSIIIFFK